MDKVLFKRILYVLLIICLVAYVIFSFAKLNDDGVVEVENAVYSTVSDVIQTEGFIVRDEKYVTASVNGELSYNINDGDNVSTNQSIADVYKDNADAVASQEIKKLNEQIQALEELNESYFKESVALDTVNTQLENKIVDVLLNTVNGDYALADSSADDLLYYINERQIITGVVKNFDEKIDALTIQRDELLNNSSDKIKSISSPSAGYFVSYVDGYENSVAYTDVKKLSLDDYNNISNTNVNDNVIGKIISNPEWFIACKIDKDQALLLSKMQGKGKGVNVTIPFVSSEKIPATIVAVNQENRKEDGVAILSCDFMSKDLSNARFENIEIETVTYSGLKVSKRAIHEDYVLVLNENGNYVNSDKKVQGVYVHYGSELVFKQISIIHSSTDFVICNPSPAEGVLLNGETIKLYDQIVIKGDDLYNGKIVS